MRLPISLIYHKYCSDITGTSVPATPQDNTVLYFTKENAMLIEGLTNHRKCLCFFPSDCEIPKAIQDDNAIIFSDNPTLEYAKFVSAMELSLHDEDSEEDFYLFPEDYYVGPNVKIGRNAYIEPDVVLGPNVKIGKKRSDLHRFSYKELDNW